MKVFCKVDSKIIGEYKYMEMKIYVGRETENFCCQQQADLFCKMSRMELVTFLCTGGFGKILLWNMMKRGRILTKNMTWWERIEW